MKGLSTVVARCVVLVWMSLFVFSADAYGTELQKYEKLESWQVNQEYINYEGEAALPQQVMNTQGWLEVSLQERLPKEASLRKGIWFRIELPQVEWESAALLLKDVRAQRIAVFSNEKLVYEESRNYVYQRLNILIPISHTDQSSSVYIYTQALQGGGGGVREIYYGDHKTLIHDYASVGREDIVIGGCIMFLSFIMLGGSVFLRKQQVKIWSAVSLIFLCVGILMCTYTSFLYNYFSAYGALFILLFDSALLLLPPLSSYVFEKVLGAGYLNSIKKYRIFMSCYALLGLVAVLGYNIYGQALYDTYHLLTVKVLGCLILLELLLLTVTAAGYALQRNKDAIIMAIAITLFAGLVGVDLISFYLKPSYEFVFWKWGIFALLGGLIVIIAHRFTVAHHKVLGYARELEMFNEVVIRSEKMEIVSELAASVAHEVKNPLQVTKGFLHLLKERSQEQEKRYLSLALDELDRATTIISDFLAFARPEVEHVTLLNVRDEFKHVYGVLSPLANMQGGRIEMDIPAKLIIKGNSAKFKQAFINMIKSSLEVMDNEGVIRIWAYRENENIKIHIQDTREGLNAVELFRLRAPHSSDKSKDNGINLMVTNRIIESMEGKIEIRSRKQAGTEVIVTLHAADEAVSQTMDDT